MKTLLRHLNEVSQERGFKDFEVATEYIAVGWLDDIIKEAGDRYAIEVSHLIVNDAICSPDSVKEKGSNACAEFVNKWIKDKL